MRSGTNSETPQQPELTSDDSLRFSREASKYGQKVHGDQCPGSVYHAFRDGAKYATLHERAAAQARIKELEAEREKMLDLLAKLSGIRMYNDLTKDNVMNELHQYLETNKHLL